MKALHVNPRISDYVFHSEEFLSFGTAKRSGRSLSPTLAVDLQSLNVWSTELRRPWTCLLLEHCENAIERAPRSALLIMFHRRRVLTFPSGSLSSQRSFQAKVNFWELSQNDLRRQWSVFEFGRLERKARDNLSEMNLTCWWTVLLKHQIHIINQLSALRSNGSRITLSMNMELTFKRWGDVQRLL